MEEEMAEMKIIIRGLLISSPNKLTVRELQNDFFKQEGRTFPFQRYGFHSFLDYLRSIRDTVTLTGSQPIYVSPVVSRETQHVNEMVLKQKISRKKPPHIPVRKKWGPIVIPPDPPKNLPTRLHVQIPIRNKSTLASQSHIPYAQEKNPPQPTMSYLQGRNPPQPTMSYVQGKNPLLSTTPVQGKNPPQPTLPFVPGKNQLQPTLQYVQGINPLPAEEFNRCRTNVRNEEILVTSNPKHGAKTTEKPVHTGYLDSVVSKPVKPEKSSWLGVSSKAKDNTQNFTWKPANSQQSNVWNSEPTSKLENVVSAQNFTQKPANVGNSKPTSKLENMVSESKFVHEDEIQNKYFNTVSTGCQNTHVEVQDRINLNEMEEETASLGSSHHSEESCESSGVSPYLPSSNRFFSEKTVTNMRSLMKQNPQGIWCSEFPAIYKEQFGVPLDYQAHGYVSMAAVAAAYSDIFVCLRRSSADFLLLSAEMPLPKHYANNLNSSACPVLTAVLKKNVERIVSDFPNGLESDKLKETYKKYFNEDLNEDEFGFPDFNGLLVCLHDESVLHLRTVGKNSIIYPRNRNLKVNEIPALSSADLDTEEVKLDCVYPKEVLDYRDTIQRQCVTTVSDNVPVIVSEVITPSKFYIILHGEPYKKLEMLMDEIQTFYATEGSRYSLTKNMIREGLYCICRYKENNEWHRARIYRTSNGSTKVKVVYVDYGTEADVEAVELRLMHSDFAKLPTQAIPACLANIEPINGGKWQKEANKAFLNLIKQRILIAEIESVLEDDCLSVALVDTNGDDDVHINDKLVEDGYAKFIHVNVTTEDSLSIPDTLRTSAPTPSVDSLPNGTFTWPQFSNKDETIKMSIPPNITSSSLPCASTANAVTGLWTGPASSTVASVWNQNPLNVGGATMAQPWTGHTQLPFWYGSIPEVALYSVPNVFRVQHVPVPPGFSNVIPTAANSQLNLVNCQLLLQQHLQPQPPALKPLNLLPPIQSFLAPNVNSTNFNPSTHSAYNMVKSEPELNISELPTPKTNKSKEYANSSHDLKVSKEVESPQNGLDENPDDKNFHMRDYMKTQTVSNSDKVCKVDDVEPKYVCDEKQKINSVPEKETFKAADSNYATVTGISKSKIVNCGSQHEKLNVLINSSSITVSDSKTIEIPIPCVKNNQTDSEEITSSEYQNCLKCNSGIDNCECKFYLENKCDYSSDKSVQTWWRKTSSQLEVGLQSEHELISRNENNKSVEYKTEQKRSVPFVKFDKDLCLVDTMSTGNQKDNDSTRGSCNNNEPEECLKENKPADSTDNKNKENNQEPTQWIRKIQKDCKKSWNLLRDTFRHAMKNQKESKSGHTTRKWKYEHKLSFLLPYFKERHTICTVHANPEVKDNDAEGNYSNGDNQARPDSPEVVIEQKSPLPKRTKVCEATVTLPSHNMPVQKRSTHRKTMSPRSSSDGTPASELMKFVLKNKSETNDIQKFFDSIATTVQSFPPQDRAVAKAEVFAVISEMELEILSRVSSPYSNYGGLPTWDESQGPELKNNVRSVPTQQSPSTATIELNKCYNDNSESGFNNIQEEVHEIYNEHSNYTTTYVPQ